MIKLDLDIREIIDWIRVSIEIKSSTSTFETEDLITIDDIEGLEQNLTNMVQKLYEYRKNKGQL